MKTLVKKFISRLLRPDGGDDLVTPAHEVAAFLLWYGDIPIGSLRLREGEWEFSYSPEFRAQADLRPLVDFPDLTRIYRSTHLWPFFMARIPSVAQPKVLATIQQEGLDRTDVALLRRFGTHTIANPFELRELAGSH